MSSSRLLLPLAFAFGLCGQAVATTTYRLGISGQIDHTVDCWETVPLCSGPPHVFTPWEGTLTLVVDGAGDGTYAGGDIDSMVFASNAGSFAIDAGAADPAWALTVVDGQVGALDALVLVNTPKDTTAFDLFQGLAIGFSGSGGTHYGSTVASGTLSAIAEPATPALLLAGGVALALLGRRRAQACASGQRGFTSNA